MKRDVKQRVLIYWDAAGKVFVAEAPDLPGWTAYGKSRQVALV